MVAQLHPHREALTCRRARSATRKLVNYAARKPVDANARKPANQRELDFGIQVFAPERQAAAPPQLECAHDEAEITADTVLLAPRRPSAPLVPSSRGASSSRSRSPLSARSDALHSPAKYSEQCSTAAGRAHRSSSPPVRTAGSFLAADALEPICIGVPVPQPGNAAAVPMGAVPRVLQSLAQAPSAGNSAESAIKTAAVPPFPLRPMNRQRPASHSILPPGQRASQHPGSGPCIATDHDSHVRSRSRSPAHPAASQSHSASIVPAVRHCEGAHGQAGARPTASGSRKAGQGEDSVEEREQLAALLGCSPAHGQSAHDAGTSQVAEQTVDGVTGASSDRCNDEDSLHGEASLRHHARSSSGAALNRSSIESGEAAGRRNPPEQPYGHERGESDAQWHRNTHTTSNPIQYQLHISDAHMPQHQHADVAIQQAGQRAPSQQSLHSEQRGNSEAWRYQEAERPAAPSRLEAALPASIRFSTTTDQGAGTPPLSIVVR